MSSITDVLRSEKKPAKKLEAISEIVKDVRKSYGNVEVDIPMPQINTIDGVLPMSALTDETKVALADEQVRTILVSVIEAEKTVPGLVAEKFVEGRIAVNDILVNLGTKTSFGAL